MTLAECLQTAGILLNFSCGGKGLCGGCLVTIEEGESLISPKAEAERNLDAGQRMACQAEIIADSGFIRGYSPFFR